MRNTLFAHTPSRARSLPVPNGTKAGTPVLVGAIVGVAITNQATNDSQDFDYGNGNATGEATVARDGAFNLNVTGPAVTKIGQAVYIAADGSALTTSSASSAVLFGYALDLKGTDPAVIPVEIALV